VLLVRPKPPNERFGLGPFFRVEPLGLEYIATALEKRGHAIRIIDERFSSPTRVIRSFRPEIVGVSCMHTVDIPTTLAAATTAKRTAPSARVVVGGHVVALYPDPFFEADVDALCVGDGEATFQDFVDAGGCGVAPRGFWVRRRAGRGRECFEAGPAAPQMVDLDDTPRPSRHLVSSFQGRYLCVHKQPVWALETARGCPYRCRFCSAALLHDRRHRLRGIDTVRADFEAVGDNVFVVDDLFFAPGARSRDLAEALSARHVRKDWILVQTRLDTVAGSPELLERWRPIARQFDLFFGFESPTDSGLGELSKDMTLATMEEGVRVARGLGYGVTGNFVIDPDWTEADFQQLWSLVDRLKLSRIGYTVLTPLPGTPLFEHLKPHILEHDWSKWDMHHVLYEPRLGRRRFFELFVECWRRNVLGAGHAAHWGRWLAGLRPSQTWTLARVLWRTQRMLRVDAYLDETFPMQVPARVGEE
jgi:radical SAM superfamily enzyme YgiQ (UPF0313 family)